MTFRRTALLLGLLLLPATVRAESTSPRTHVVYDGQRLGSIAKRYGVSVDAICTANELRPSDALKPGQKLVIPARSDRDGTRARASMPHDGTRRRNASEPPSTHRVESGQRLESIAKRYGVTVDALRRANQLAPKSIIRPGDVLRIPDPNAPEGSEAGVTDAHGYLRPPAHRGQLELIGYSEHFHGQVVDRKGRVLPAAVEGACRVLAATGTRPRLDPRLVRLMSEVSDAFGGRPLRVVSGYRTTSFFRDSRHKLSKAVDFSIPGVPNEVVRDYLRTLKNVGVGYYPNSSFVHLDVREYSAYWVDYAGPGEAPRGKHHSSNAEDVHEEEPGDVPSEPSASTQLNSGPSVRDVTEKSEAPSTATTQTRSLDLAP